jgi:MarR family transcriptional regulator, organic hydroperoxide resistance regulator
LGKGISVAPTKTIRLEDFLPFLINRVGVALAANFSATGLRARGLSINDWRVLAILANRRRQRQVDLAEMTSIDPSTLSRLVARLIRMGLVTRLRSRKSDREVEVQLTAKGRTTVQELTPIAARNHQMATRGVSSARIALMKDVLRTMYDNLVENLRRENGRNHAQPRRVTRARR